MSACPGTCTVRIFETRGLKLERAPSGMDEETALRFLEGTVKAMTGEQKESGCEHPGCECTPLADYLPDPNTGRRKKEPEWTDWRLRNVITEVGDPPRIEFVFGTVESRSAIVPGLCEEGAFMELRTVRGRPTRKPDKRPRKRSVA